MKRLILVLLIVTFSLAPLIAAAQVAPSAPLSGKYKMIASGSCIHSQNGYTKNDKGWLITKPGIAYAGTTTWRGTWNFYSDPNPVCTKTPGEYRGQYYDKFSATVVPAPSVNGGIRLFSDGYKPDGTLNPVLITYSYDPEKREITVYDGDAIYIGDVSAPNGEVITLLEANHVINGPMPAPWWSITCNTSRTLIYVGPSDSEALWPPCDDDTEE